MATISCLETRAVAERQTEIARSDYNYSNEYSSMHPDALSSSHGGSGIGKGTGSSGHGFWLPHCTSVIGQYNFSNFSTRPADNAGNDADITARNDMSRRSLYNSATEYPDGLTMTIYNGQYFVP